MEKALYAVAAVRPRGLPVDRAGYRGALRHHAAPDWRRSAGDSL